MRTHINNQAIPVHSLGLAIEPFTRQEIQTLYLAAMDKSVTQTAEIICISPDTIKGYRKRILDKTGCRSITGVVGFMAGRLFGDDTLIKSG